MAIKTEKREGVYVDLDCLLDTRLGTVNLIDQQIAEDILLKNIYHSRDQDLFEGIDRELFKKKYSERDTETLSNSLLTNIVPLIKHLVSQLNEQAIQRPFHDGGKVIVNCFPYKLASEEISEIEKAITVWLGSTAPIVLINKPLDEITPKYCKENFALMFMYSYNDWMEVNANGFLEVQIPEISLFSPAIYFEKKPTEDEMKKLIKDSMHPLEAVEFAASPLISLVLVDVKYFSIISKN